MSRKWVFLSASALMGTMLVLLSMGDGSPPVNQGVPAVKAAPSYINASWADNELWYDGNAEVNVYDAKMNIYGRARSCEYVYVFVKEDFTPEYRVKTDDYSEKDIYPVMKCNQFARVPTDNYPYHFLTSLFFRWENPAQLHKMTASSQEWCGNTFKEFLETEKGFRFDFHSYWDGQGDGQMNVEGAWFEDQLAYTLRSLNFKDGMAFEHSLYGTEKHSKARKPLAQTAKFEVSEQGEAWGVSVATKSGQSTYLFQKAYPNKLVGLKTWWGLELRLKKSDRYPYWAYTPEHMK